MENVRFYKDNIASTVSPSPILNRSRTIVHSKYANHESKTNEDTFPRIKCVFPYLCHDCNTAKSERELGPQDSQNSGTHYYRNSHNMAETPGWSHGRAVSGK